MCEQTAVLHVTFKVTGCNEHVTADGVAFRIAHHTSRFHTLLMSHANEKKKKNSFIIQNSSLRKMQRNLQRAASIVYEVWYGLCVCVCEAVEAVGGHRGDGGGLQYGCN